MEVRTAQMESKEEETDRDALADTRGAPPETGR